jgi:hypothetical protein
LSAEFVLTDAADKKGVEAEASQVPSDVEWRTTERGLFRKAIEEDLTEHDRTICCHCSVEKFVLSRKSSTLLDRKSRTPVTAQRPRSFSG